MVYNNLSREEVLEIYDFVIEKRKESLGQRRIFQAIKEKFNKEINENTIAGWIFCGNVPFASEKTQFKTKEIPQEEELYKLYLEEKQSAQKIAGKYNVSTITAINWLKHYDILVRTHLESMNTSQMKKELREKKLRMPTKEFSKLSPEKSYLLAVLCGDGHIHPGMIRLEIRKDEEFIKEFSSCLKKVYGLEFKHYYYAKRNSFILYASPEIVCNDLLKYGKFGTFDWNVPKEIMESNDEKIISSFLRGIFDSEGSVTKCSVLMCSANKKGIEEIKILLKKIGIESKITKTKAGYYILWIFRKERFKIFRKRVGFTIKRKMDKLNEILKNDKSYKPA